MTEQLIPWGSYSISQATHSGYSSARLHERVRIVLRVCTSGLEPEKDNSSSNLHRQIPNFRLYVHTSLGLLQWYLSRKPN